MIKAALERLQCQRERERGGMVIPDLTMEHHAILELADRLAVLEQRTATVRGRPGDHLPFALVPRAVAESLATEVAKAAKWLGPDTEGDRLRLALADYRDAVGN